MLRDGEVVKTYQTSTSIVMAIVVILAAILVLIIATSAVRATECQHRPDHRGSWTWRHIEPHVHARCWYRGRHVISKSRLHWPTEKPKPVKMDLPNGIRAEQEPDIDDATECCWPQLPIADGSGNTAPSAASVPDFTERWNDVPAAWFANSSKIGR